MLRLEEIFKATFKKNGCLYEYVRPQIGPQFSVCIFELNKKLIEVKITLYIHTYISNLTGAHEAGFSDPYTRS